MYSLGAVIGLVPIFVIVVQVDAKALTRIQRASSTYTTKYDNIDVDAILASNRLLKNYVNCLLDKGPCTNEGKELKSKSIYEIIFVICKKK